MPVTVSPRSAAAISGREANCRSPENVGRESATDLAAHVADEVVGAGAREAQVLSVFHAAARVAQHPAEEPASWHDARLRAHRRERAPLRVGADAALAARAPGQVQSGLVAGEVVLDHPVHECRAVAQGVLLELELTHEAEAV